MDKISSTVDGFTYLERWLAEVEALDVEDADVFDPLHPPSGEEDARGPGDP
jgi:hypothetical protein